MQRGLLLLMRRLFIRDEGVMVNKSASMCQGATFGSSLYQHGLRLGLSSKTVQTFAGHSSLKVTMVSYGHLFPSDDQKAELDAIAGEFMG